MSLRRTIIVAMLAGTAFPAYAQPAPTDLAAVEDSAIIVTAQRRAERLQDVPISITVQSSEQLQAAGVVDTRGLESVTPGLTMQAQSSFLQPALRGVTTSVVAPGADNPIAFYLDGVYVSGANASVIALPDVERIEVLKGPQGTLFGRNATGGAIQIFTKAPSFEPNGKVEAILGYYDGAGSSRSAYDLGVQGFVSGPIVQDQVAASISFSHRRSNGYGTNIAFDQAPGTFKRRVNKLEDELIRGKLLFTPADNLEVLFTGYYTRRDTDQGLLGYVPFGASSAAGFPDAVISSRPWRYAFDAPRPHAVLKAGGASMKIDLTTEAGTFTSTTAYAKSNSTEFVDSDGAYSPTCLAAFACVGVRDQFIDKNISQEFLFSSEKFGRFSAVAGVFLYRSNGFVDVTVNDFPDGAFPGAPQVVNPAIFFYDETIKTRAIGAFAEANYELTDALTLIAGLRYSWEEKKATLRMLGGPGIPVADPSWDSFTPRVSLRYALDSRTNVYATVSKGFKSGVIPIGDPTAQPANPEKLTAYEVGFKTAQPGYSFNFAAFYYDYKDLQVQSNAGAGGALVIVNNAATARIYGIDVDGTVNLAEGLSLRGGISWLPHADFRSYPGAVATLPVAIGGFPAGSVPIDLSGSRLYRTPKVTLTAGATYETQVGGGTLSISPNLYYASNLFIEATHLVRADNLRIGAQIAYKPDDSGFRFALWGKNLTNEDAFVSAAINNNGWGLVPQPPRQLGLTIGYEF